MDEAREHRIAVIATGLVQEENVNAPPVTPFLVGAVHKATRQEQQEHRESESASDKEPSG